MMQPIENPFQENQINIPIRLKRKKLTFATDKQLTLMVLPPNNEIYDFAIEVNKKNSIYRLYNTQGVWIRTYCRKCRLYMTNDNSSINTHHLRKHNKSQEEWSSKLVKFSLKLYLLHENYANIVEKRDFVETFGASIFSSTLVEYMHKIYNEELEMLKKILEQEPFVTIYFDEWTRFSINFIGISVSSKSNVFALDVVAPDDIDRTRETVRNLVCSRLQWFGLTNKIAFHCTDCASNVVALLATKWFPCTNHILNRCVEDMLPELERAMKIAEIILMYQDLRKTKGKPDLKKGIPYLNFEDRCVIEDCQEFFAQLMMIMKELESDSPETIFWALSNILTVYYDISKVITDKGYVRAAEKLKLGILLRLKK